DRTIQLHAHLPDRKGRRRRAGRDGEDGHGELRLRGRHIGPAAGRDADAAAGIDTLRPMVTIYGKDSCPYTQAARDDHERRKVAFTYINVKKNAAELARMLEFSKGRR